jgi:hypothetical protein
MADFMTRLAERTFGVGSVVQPMILPAFADEHADQTDLEWDGEVAAPPEERTDSLVRAAPAAIRVAQHEVPNGTAPREVQAPTTRTESPHFETSSPPASLPRPADSETSGIRTTSRSEAHESPVPATPDHPKAPLGTPEPGPTENGADVSRDSRGDLPQPTTRSPRGTSEPQPWSPSDLRETNSIEHRMVSQRNEQAPARARMEPVQEAPQKLHHADREPAQHDSLPTSQRTSTERSSSGPSEAEREVADVLHRAVTTLVEGQKENHEREAAFASVSATHNGSSQTAESDMLPAPEVAPGRSRLDIPPSVAPGTIRPRLASASRPERSPQEDTRPDTPEPSASTVRISIGRIEVRAIVPPTLPAPPAQRATSTRPGPELSLDDYLKQRNGGQR